MSPGRIRLRRPLRARVAATLALAAALACGDCANPPPAASPAATLDESVVSEAPWERAFDDAERTSAVEGRILAPSGAEFDAAFVPCPGAEVEVWLPRPDGRTLERRVAAVKTGEDGRFRAEGIVADAFALRATREGHAVNLGGRGLRVFGAIPVGPSPAVEMAVLPARRLRGIVVDPANRPYRGVRVVANSVGSTAETRTDDSGAFAVDVPAGGVGLAVLDAQCDVVRRTAEVPSDREPDPVRLVARAAEPLAGTVTDAASGAPLAGAVVTWLDEPGHVTRSGPDGRFVLAVPRMGRIAAYTGGRQWRSWAVPRAGEIGMPLRESRGLSGRVIDAKGFTVADARLLAVGLRWDGGYEAILGPRTDAGGRFDFSWAPDPPRGTQRPTFVVAWHRQRGASVPLALPTRAEEAYGPRDLVLSGWRAVEGELRDSGGAPVAGAVVRAEWALEGLEPLEVAALSLPAERDSRTGPDGRFRLTDLPGTIPVTVRADVAGLSLNRVLAPGAAGPVRLDLPRGEDLRGRVLRRNREAPGAGGEVRARLLDAPTISLERAAKFGPDGVFAFEDVPPGRYALTATAEGYDLPGGAEAHAGDRDAQVVVEKSALLHLRVLGAENAGETKIFVWLDDLGNVSIPGKRHVLPPEAAPDGARELHVRVHPGNWRVRIEGDVWRGGIEKLSLDDGEERTETVRLEATLRVRGVLRDGAGSPLAGVQVLFVPAERSNGTPITTFTGDGGVLDVAGLRPGRWEVRASPRLHAPFRTEVDLPSAEPLDLRMPPHGTIVVRLRDSAGAPLKDGIVSLRQPAGGDAFGWSEGLPNLASRFRADADGAVRISGVPVGDVRVEGAAGPVRLAPSTVPVRAGETAEVVLEPRSEPR